MMRKKMSRNNELFRHNRYIIIPYFNDIYINRNNLLIYWKMLEDLKNVKTENKLNDSNNKNDNNNYNNSNQNINCNKSNNSNDKCLKESEKKMNMTINME